MPYEMTPKAVAQKIVIQRKHNKYVKDTVTDRLAMIPRMNARRKSELLRDRMALERELED